MPFVRSTFSLCSVARSSDLESLEALSHCGVLIGSGSLPAIACGVLIDSDSLPVVACGVLIGSDFLPAVVCLLS